MPGPALLAVDPREAELLALYARVEKLISRKINAAIATGARGTAAYYSNQAASVMKEVEKLRTQAAPLERAISASAYTAGVAAVDTTVDRAAAFTNVHAAALDVIAGNLAGRLRFAEEFVGRMVNDTFRRIGLQETGLAIGAGLDARTQRIRMERELRRNGITAFVDRRGRRWSLTSYTAMVTRTTTREAATAGTANRMGEVGLDLVTISQHPGSCPICKPLQGKTYSLTGNSRNYPVLKAAPPIHPNCRHVMYPARASFEEFERSLGLGPDPTLAGQMGLLPEEPRPEPVTEPETINLGATTGTQQAGKDLSGLVNVSPRAKSARPMKAALREIDKVHGIPEATTHPINVETNSQMRSFGRFRGFDLRRNGKGGALIELNTARQDLEGQALTAIHESGHYLDQWGLPGGALSKQSTRWKRGEETAVNEVMDAIAASPPIEALKAGLRVNGVQRQLEFGVPANAKPSHLRYLLEPPEMFARAYAQYIASRSRWRGLKRAVEDDRSFIPQRQWTDEEFAPIAAAFDAMFRDLDLLRT